MAPMQEASLEPPCSNLKSFGSKCTVLKKVLVTLLGLFGAPIVIRRPGNCAPIVAPLGTTYFDVKTISFMPANSVLAKTRHAVHPKFNCFLRNKAI